MSNDKFIIQDGLTINTVEVFNSDGILIGPSGNTLNAVYIHANSAYNQANTTNNYAYSAYSEANAAYSLAASKVSKSGDTMTGDLTVPNITASSNIESNYLIVDTTIDRKSTRLNSSH